MAQTANSPVRSANSGKVIYADRLGLYGNCVILDHGYSLQRLYGHVSGATGMAFGDHLHFSMMVAGVQIDPKEWWDEHWIKDRILSKIGPGASSTPVTASAAPAPSNADSAVRRNHKHTGGKKS